MCQCAKRDQLYYLHLAYLRDANTLEPKKILGDSGFFNQLWEGVTALVSPISLQHLHCVVGQVVIERVVMLVAKHTLAIIPEPVKAKHLVIEFQKPLTLPALTLIGFQSS